MGGDIGRHLDLATLDAPPEGGRAGWPARPAPSRPRQANLARSTAPIAGRPRSRSERHADREGPRAPPRASRGRTSGWSRTCCSGSALHRGGRRPATCAPTSRAAAGSRRRRSPRRRRRAPAGRSRRRTPKPSAARLARRRPAGRRTTPPCCAGSIGDPVRAPARSAAGTARRAAPAPRPHSSRPSAPRPARCRAVDRRGPGRSRPPPLRSARRRSRSRAGRCRPAPRTTSPRRTSRHRRVPTAQPAPPPRRTRAALLATSPGSVAHPNGQGPARWPRRLPPGRARSCRSR